MRPFLTIIAGLILLFLESLLLNTALFTSNWLTYTWVIILWLATGFITYKFYQAFAKMEQRR